MGERQHRPTQLDTPVMPTAGLGPVEIAAIRTPTELARALRQLRRRWARQRGEPQPTYRQLAGKTGWSYGVISEYFTGKVLPPTERFDVLIRLLGASPAEQQSLATARDRVDDLRREARDSDADATGTGMAAMATVPRQLPGDISGFTGRVTHLRALDGLLTPDRATVVIAAISGTAGVGKTALAVRWAHRVADEFPDGQLYLNLRGFDPDGAPTDPAEALRGFLVALAVPPDRIPSDPAHQAGAFRTLLADRRMLIVLDNAATVEQVRPLLPGGRRCLVLITSRRRLVGLATLGAELFALEPFTDEEARQLLATRVGARRTATEPAATTEIITRCARLPLALAVVAARAAAHPGLSLGALARELRGAGGTHLDALDGGDATSDVRTVFSWSYRTLSPPAARLFRWLGLHGGPDVSVAAAASIAGVGLAEVRPWLLELTRSHLAAEHTPDRYAFHDLLRAYADELARDVDDPAERHRIVHRILDHYVHTAHTAAMLQYPQRDPMSLDPPQPGVTPERLTDHDHAIAWFAAEHIVLLRIIALAEREGFDRHVWCLAWTLSHYLDRTGHWRDVLAAQRAALNAARRLDDRAAQAYSHRITGLGLDRLGDFDEAVAHHHQALALYGEVRDRTGQAHTLMALGALFDRLGRHEDCLRCSQAALDLYRHTGHLVGQADALNTVGWTYTQLGDHALAVTHCQQGLALHQRLGDRYGEAACWDSLGLARHHLGELERAMSCYGEALRLYQDIGDLRNRAEVLIHLGDTHEAMEHPDRARTCWQQALDIYDDLHHPRADRLRARLGRRDR